MFDSRGEFDAVRKRLGALFEDEAVEKICQESIAAGEYKKCIGRKCFAFNEVGERTDENGNTDAVYVCAKLVQKRF